MCIRDSPSCAEWRPLTVDEHTLVRGVVPALDPPVTRVHEGRGCAQCAQSGYRGRAAITELLVPDDAMRAAFVQGASLDVLRAMARARGVASLLHDGWRAVRDGRTTIAEVTRVVSEEDGR